MLCASGVDIMAQMPLASEVIRRLVPSFSLSMIRVDRFCTPQEHYSEHFDEFSHQLFASAGHVFSARSEDPAAFGNLLRSPRAVGNLIDVPPAYLAGATYQHLFQRNGIHHCLDVALRDSGGPIGILGIFREREAPAFTHRDVTIVSELYEHLVHACVARPVSASFDEIDGAMMIATLDGRIEWASPQACAWLQEATFGEDRTRLIERGLLPEACRTLCHNVQALRRPRRSGESEASRAPTLTVPFPGGRLRLRAYTLDGTASVAQAMPVHVGIQLSLEMRRDLRVLAALERAALTPQQRRIAFALWQGSSPSGLRTALDLSENTLKSYQKDLYARLGVSSVTELRELLDRQAEAIVLDLRRHRPTGV